MFFSLRALARAAAAIAAGALAGLIALTIASWFRGPIADGMTAELSRRVMTGFYPPERVGDLSFAWTAGRADLVLAGLARDRVWTCAVRLRAARAIPPVPRLDILVDGVQVVSRDAPNSFEDVSFDLPARSSHTDTRVSFAVTPTLVPGPQDRRPLGVQVDRIACMPQTGRYMPPSPASRVAAAAVPAAFAGAAVLGGAPLAGAMAIAVVLAGAQTVPLDTGIAAYTPFVRVMLSAGIWIALVTLTLIKLVEALRRRALSAFVTTFTVAVGAALYLQLLGLLHPSKPPIDVVFQAHRFDAVVAGNYFFTQPMPGGVSFPYAIGLYLFALPWARFTSDHATLLRIVVCASDAVGYVLLFWLVSRTWRDRAAAATALMVAFALPIAFEVIGNANLTNEFGHAASTAALVLAAALPGSRRRVPHAMLLTAVCTLALVAHVSTFLLLAFTLFALAVLFWWTDAPGFRRAAVALLAVTILSSALAFAGYYGHFMDVYKDAIRVRTGGVSPTVPAAPPAEIRGQTAHSLPLRVLDAAGRTAGWVGWPLLVLAGAGAWRVVRDRRRDPATLAILACGAAYVVFVGVAVMRVQPAYQRYTVEFVSRVVLATSPGVVLLAGAGASWGFRNGLLAKLGTCFLIAAAFAVAGREWIGWFT